MEEFCAKTALPFERKINAINTLTIMIAVVLFCFPFFIFFLPCPIECAMWLLRAHL